MRRLVVFVKHHVVKIVPLRIVTEKFPEFFSIHTRKKKNTDIFIHNRVKGNPLCKVSGHPAHGISVGMGNKIQAVPENDRSLA